METVNPVTAHTSRGFLPSLLLLEVELMETNGKALNPRLRVVGVASIIRSGINGNPVNVRDNHLLPLGVASIIRSGINGNKPTRF